MCENMTQKQIQRELFSICLVSFSGYFKHVHPCKQTLAQWQHYLKVIVIPCDKKTQESRLYGCNKVVSSLSAPSYHDDSPNKDRKVSAPKKHPCMSPSMTLSSMYKSPTHTHFVSPFIQCKADEIVSSVFLFVFDGDRLYCGSNRL